MKYEIKLSSKFKKHFKKLDKKEQSQTREIIERLANDEVLEQKYKDHALQGNYKNFRECHIKPDLLLVYQKQDDFLILYCLDIDSHSNLFE